jgi:signal peptide peptidase SppA
MNATNNIKAMLNEHRRLLIEPLRWQNLLAMDYSATIGEDEDIYGDPLPVMTIDGNRAIIPIKGVLVKGLPSIAAAFGYVDPASVEANINEAEASDDVEEIIFDIDSPGGTVAGIPELASRIAAIEKPTRAFSDGMICSAAYWLASQCDAIQVTESAEIGSIGVYLAMQDLSELYAQAGVGVEMFKSGDLKGIGVPGTSLTDAQREHLQAGVEEIFAMFKAAVTSKRTAVDDDSMRGQSFLGRKAAERGLVTGIVTGIDRA